MKLIILDRDGVINHDSDDYIKSAEEWQPIPGSMEAIARLTQAGYRIVVVSNQAGLAHGRFTIEDLNAIHRRMHTRLEQHGGSVEAVLFCPHGPDEECDCRKPRPGLLQELSRRLRLALDQVIMVGDKLSDIEAARAVRARPVLVRTGYGRALEDDGGVPDGVPVFDDLAALVDDLLAAG